MEYGGTNGSVEDLAEFWKKEVEASAEWLKIQVWSRFAQNPGFILGNFLLYTLGTPPFPLKIITGLLQLPFKKGTNSFVSEGGVPKVLSRNLILPSVIVIGRGERSFYLVGKQIAMNSKLDIFRRRTSQRRIWGGGLQSCTLIFSGLRAPFVNSILIELLYALNTFL